MSGWWLFAGFAVGFVIAGGIGLGVLMKYAYDSRWRV